MSDDILGRLANETGLVAVETMAESATDAPLEQLLTLHLHHFPDHAHVGDELRLARRVGPHDPDVIIHAWLLHVDSVPVGFVIFHTNLRRRIVLQHFVGMDEDTRAQLPFRWISHLSDAVVETGVLDAETHGLELLGAMGENPPQHEAAWHRLGYRTIDVDYREPNHGMHWAEFGPITYFPMTAMVRLTTAGDQVPFDQVATAAVSAFLLDHYQLPADDPTVTAILARAAALPS